MRIAWLIVLCFAEIPVAHAREARVVVVADRASLGRRAATSVRMQLEKPLKSRVALVANDDYVRHALKLGYQPGDLAATDIAATVGAGVGATHVLVLAGKKKKRKRRILIATLIDVHSGVADRIATARVKRRLAAASSSKLVAGVVERVRVQLPEPEPEPEPTAVAMTSVEDDGSFDGALPSWAGNAVHQNAPADNSRRDEAIGFRLAPAAVAFQRECAIRPREHADAIRHYRTDSFIPGLGLDVELYPFTLDRDKSALDNVGLQARGYAARVASRVSGSEDSGVSIVWAADGGLTYRAEARGWTIAPSMLLRVGYGAFSFPVANTEFPDLMYAGPSASLRLAANIAGVVILFAEGGYLHPIQIGGEAGTFGRLKNSSTHAYHGEGGFAVRLGWLEIGASARLERFTLGFGGSAALDDIELYDARIDDRVISGSAWIGLAL